MENKLPAELEPYLEIKKSGKQYALVHKKEDRVVKTGMMLDQLLAVKPKDLVPIEVKDYMKLRKRLGDQYAIVHRIDEKEFIVSIGTLTEMFQEPDRVIRFIPKEDILKQQ